jgi:acyl-CoA thioesterase-1
MGRAFQRERYTAYGACRALSNSIALITVLSAAGTGAAFAEPLTLVALGDSLTQGYGLRQEDGLVPQLERWLEGKGRDVDVINAGVSGDTTAGGASRVDWTLTDDVDAMIVNLGGNDLLRGIDPAEVRGNLDAILAAATARDIPVLLVALRAPGNWGPDYKAAFDAIYPDLAARHGAQLTGNFFAPLVDQTTRNLATGLMQPDGIHPNAAGVAKVVEALGPEVLLLLDRTGG